MALRKITQLGHTVLRKTAEPVDEKDILSPEVQSLVDDMIQTLQDAAGAGLAAPQVHESRRIFIVESGTNPEKRDHDKPPLVFINPQIIRESEDREYDWEGCLSIPDVWGRVPRAKEIRVKAVGKNGQSFEMAATDFLARKILHEYDHLEGILFLDRMDDMETITMAEQFRKYWYPEHKEPTPA